MKRSKSHVEATEPVQGPGQWRLDPSYRQHLVRLAVQIDETSKQLQSLEAQFTNLVHLSPDHRVTAGDGVTKPKETT